MDDKIKEKVQMMELLHTQQFIVADKEHGKRLKDRWTMSRKVYFKRSHNKEAITCLTWDEVDIYTPVTTSYLSGL